MAKWNKGFSKARFESDRSGFSYPRSEMIKEPGTGVILAREESDGQFSRTLHPQTKQPKVQPERSGLKDPRPLRGNYRDSYLINDWNHSEQVNPNQPLEYDTPLTTEEGQTILIEGYDP